MHLVVRHPAIQILAWINPCKPKKSLFHRIPCIYIGLVKNVNFTRECFFLKRCMKEVYTLLWLSLSFLLDNPLFTFVPYCLSFIGGPWFCLIPTILPLTCPTFCLARLLSVYSPAYNLTQTFLFLGLVINIFHFAGPSSWKRTLGFEIQNSGKCM